MGRPGHVYGDDQAARAVGTPRRNRAGDDHRRRPGRVRALARNSIAGEQAWFTNPSTGPAATRTDSPLNAVLQLSSGGVVAEKAGRYAPAFQGTALVRPVVGSRGRPLCAHRPPYPRMPSRRKDGTAPTTVIRPPLRGVDRRAFAARRFRRAVPAARGRATCAARAGRQRGECARPPRRPARQAGHGSCPWLRGSR